MFKKLAANKILSDGLKFKDFDIKQTVDQIFTQNQYFKEKIEHMGSHSVR